VGLVEHFSARKKHYISYLDWDKINRHEIQAGSLKNKPREKVTRISEMLEIATKSIDEN